MTMTMTIVERDSEAAAARRGSHNEADARRNIKRGAARAARRMIRHELDAICGLANVGEEVDADHLAD